MSSTPQTILSLRAENTKRLSAVELHPDGRPVVVIGGRNGQGKSSVLDALTWAFAGKSALPGQPIRQGAEKASILVRTQNYVVERRITASGSTVAVRAADGSACKSPQAVLDAMLSDIAFDPIGFIRAKPKEQAQALAQLIGLDVAKIEAERAKLYEQRTDANRQAKAAEAQALPFEHDTPTEEVSAADLMREVQASEQAQAQRQRQSDEVARLRKRVDDIQAQIEALHAEAVAAEQHASAIQQELDIFEAHPIDTDALRRRIAEVDQTNRAVRARLASEQAAAQADRFRAQAERLTAAMADIDARKARAIAESALPVQGLGFDGDAVTLHGVPLGQASSAEQLRVSVAVALAQWPGLRVAIIRDGSLLDSDSLALVAQLAAEAGAQVWIERVGDGAEVGVVIEDGAVLEDRMGDEPPASPSKPTKSQAGPDLPPEPAAKTETKAEPKPAPKPAPSDADLF